MKQRVKGIEDLESAFPSIWERNFRIFNHSTLVTHVFIHRSFYVVQILVYDTGASVALWERLNLQLS